MKTKLVSPDLGCRIFGCQTCVPPQGGYPGMPQSHCYYCGMKTPGAAHYCIDFDTPAEPRPFNQRLARWVDRFNAWRAARRARKAQAV